MNPNYRLVAGRARHRCEYCHAPEAIFNFPHEVEHIVPRSVQGTDHDNNLALSCRCCNLRKADFVTGIDETTGKEERLFHPRSDVWDEHFSVDLATGIIRGLTPVGRATVLRLQMNSSTQLEARRLWLELGIFP
jgi:HNH endonuclease